MKCPKQIGFNLYSSFCQPFFFTTSFFPTLSNSALSKCQCHLYLVTLSAITPLPGIHNSPMSWVPHLKSPSAICLLSTTTDQTPGAPVTIFYLHLGFCCVSLKTLEFLHIFLLAVIFALSLDVISTY